MTQDSVITDEMRNLVGVESEPSVYQIEREPIRRWAEAIGDTNPLYHDEEYAKKKGHRGLVAPPAFVCQYAYPTKVGKSAGRVRSPFTRNLNGGNEYEFFKTVCAGDILTATTKLAEIFERPGRLGTMLFIIYETTFRDEKGEVVAKSRGTGISY